MWVNSLRRDSAIGRTDSWLLLRSLLEAWEERGAARGIISWKEIIALVMLPSYHSSGEAKQQIAQETSLIATSMMYHLTHVRQLKETVRVLSTITVVCIVLTLQLSNRHAYVLETQEHLRVTPLSVWFPRNILSSVTVRTPLSQWSQVLQKTEAASSTEHNGTSCITTDKKQLNQGAL